MHVALDLYVMPLSRFLSGEFEPLEPKSDTDPKPPESCPADEASRRARAIRDALSEATGVTQQWPDEGDVAYSRRMPRRNLHALRSFAAWHEYPPKPRFLFRQFKLLEDPRDAKPLRKIYQGANTRYPHLMRHSDDRGFFFPADFKEPEVSNEAKWWKIGSIPRLRGELDALEAIFDAETPDAVREGHAVLKEACDIAHQRSLPIAWT